jgi:hypothetical protein
VLLLATYGNFTRTMLISCRLRAPLFRQIHAQTYFELDTFIYWDRMESKVLPIIIVIIHHYYY